MALNDHDMAELLGLVIFPEDPANIIIKVMRRLVSHIRFDQDSFYRVISYLKKYLHHISFQNRYHA